MKWQRICDDKSAQFVRAYEAAVVETIDSVLRMQSGGTTPGRIK